MPPELLYRLHASGSFLGGPKGMQDTTFQSMQDRNPPGAAKYQFVDAGCGKAADCRVLTLLNET